MAEINPEKKQQAKAVAANAAVAANDTAAVLGTAGAVIAFAGVASGGGALAGVGVGSVLAVGSFCAWMVANRYQRLANDPARDDFDQVSECFARLKEEVVSVDEPEATLHRFAAHQIILFDALNALILSLERHEGALGADAINDANRQAEAARHNACIAIGEQDILSELAGSINQAWDAAQQDLSWESTSIEEIQRFYASACGPPSAPSGEPLQTVLDSVIDLVDTDLFASLDVSMDPVLSLVALPAKPQLLVDGTFLDTLGSLSTSLRDLVVETP